MRILKTIVSTALILSALIVTFLVVEQEFFRNNNNSNLHKNISPDVVLPDTLWQIVSASRIGSGMPSAPVKIVEFYDYECSFCAEMQHVLNKLHIRYPDKISIWYRHYPLPHHTGAYMAAISAECASDQGAFDAFHELLFTYQSQLSGSLNWQDLADKAQIQDKDSFVNCIMEEQPAYRIMKDTEIADILNLQGVPTLVINEEVYYGALDENEIGSIIKTKLNM
ncbi:MAG: thioredoxin domain-containing protein [Bacteroidetes bacterium]|nr:thioredoxin domain-containing protein [Bacteroidota bacterium]MCY4205543.1 thioredoxin domain-containing protein [Bacteroidota bacterium]